MHTIRYTELSLTEIIEESNLILGVRCLGDYTEEIVIKNRESDLPIPSFNKTGFVFEIEEVLKNTSGIQVPKRLEIPNEDWRRSFNQHKEKYSNGTSKRYEVKEYKSDIKSFKKASILFLHHFQGIYELTAKNSFESSAAREKITILLNNS